MLTYNIQDNGTAQLGVDTRRHKVHQNIRAGVIPNRWLHVCGAHQDTTVGWARTPGE